MGNGWLSNQNLLGGAGENVKSQLEGKGTTWSFGVGAQKALTEPTGLTFSDPTHGAGKMAARSGRALGSGLSHAS